MDRVRLLGQKGSRKAFLSTALCIVLGMAAVAWGTNAMAQEGGGRGGRGRGFGGFGFGRGGGLLDQPTLLGSNQVREELKVSEEQGKKIDEILTAHREAMREFRGGRGRDLSQEEREKLRTEMTAKRAALTKETDKKLAGVLQAEQSKRLQEIVLQQQGVDGLLSESVLAALKIGEEQQGKIKATLQKRDEAMQELFSGFRGRGRDGGGGGGGFEEFREKSTKIRTDSETAVMACLTDSQKEAFGKLKGKPFELDRRSLFGGRRGAGFGGGQGRRQGGEDGGNRPRRRPSADDDA